MRRLVAISKYWLALWILVIGWSSSKADEPASAPRIPAAAHRITADVVYGHKDGLALTLDVYRPKAKGNRAGILFMVSGGWYSRWSPPEQALGLFQPYLDAGYTMFAVRHGSSPRYSIPDAISDVTSAVRFVRSNALNYEVDPEKLGAMGMSAGGHLALMLGTTGDDGSVDADGLEHHSSRLAGVVALVPPTDLRVAVWESPETLPAYRNFPALDLPMKQAEESSPLVHVTEDDAPALIVMGEKDELVPPKHGQWMADALAGQNVRHQLIIVPNADHGLEGDENRQTVTQAAINWFDSCLKTTGTKTTGADRAR